MRGPASELEVAAYRPRLSHPDWRLVERKLDGEFYMHRRRPLSLIWSIAREEDGRLWLHLSVAHRDRPPSWAEMVEAKEWVVGTDAYAYQVAPPRSRYVNQNPDVLHLFRLLEGDGRVLPEFSGVTTEGALTL